MRFFGLMIFSCTLFSFFSNTNPYECTIGKNPDRTTNPSPQSLATTHNMILNPKFDLNPPLLLLLSMNSKPISFIYLRESSPIGKREIRVRDREERIKKDKKERESGCGRKKITESTIWSIFLLGWVVKNSNIEIWHH